MTCCRPKRVGHDDLHLACARDRRQSVDRERTGRHVLARHAPAVHEHVHRRRHDGLALCVEQRRRHQRRLRREVGAELHAAEAGGTSPGARSADRVADAQRRKPLRKIQCPGRVEAQDLAPIVVVPADQRVRDHAARAEHADVEDRAEVGPVVDLLAEQVVVDESAEVGGRDLRRVGRQRAAARRQESVGRQRDARALRRVVEGDAGADPGVQSQVALAIDSRQAARWRRQPQLRQVVGLDQQRAVEVATDDQGRAFGLVVEPDLDDARLERRGASRGGRARGRGQRERQGQRQHARPMAHGPSGSDLHLEVAGFGGSLHPKSLPIGAGGRFVLLVVERPSPGLARQEVSGRRPAGSRASSPRPARR